MEKEKNFWRLEEVELNALETAIFNAMLTISTGRKTFNELNEIGELKANKKGGFTMEFDVSGEKRASFLFGRSRYDKYEYRAVAFFRNVIKES